MVIKAKINSLNSMDELIAQLLSTANIPELSFGQQVKLLYDSKLAGLVVMQGESLNN